MIVFISSLDMSEKKLKFMQRKLQKKIQEIKQNTSNNY